MVRDRAPGEKGKWFVHLESGGKAAALQILEAEGVHPGGNADVCERKGLGGKAICKTMKTKGEQIGFGAER
jgi:hypothetical protein